MSAVNLKKEDFDLVKYLGKKQVNQIRQEVIKNVKSRVGLIETAEQYGYFLDEPNCLGYKVFDHLVLDSIAVFDIEGSHQVFKHVKDLVNPDIRAQCVIGLYSKITEKGFYESVDELAKKYWIKTADTIMREKALARIDSGIDKLVMLQKRCRN